MNEGTIKFGASSMEIETQLKHLGYYGMSEEGRVCMIPLLAPNFLDLYCFLIISLLP